MGPVLMLSKWFPVGREAFLADLEIQLSVCTMTHKASDEHDGKSSS